jgi:hypothetical protein
MPAAKRLKRGGFLEVETADGADDTDRTSAETICEICVICGSSLEVVE